MVVNSALQQRSDFLHVDNLRLECQWTEPDRLAQQEPVLVLLHEGLGSIGLWRDFPSQLALSSQLPVFAYSRAGYGQSDPAVLPRPLDYMQQEASGYLPHVLQKLQGRKRILVGHSDGASIAAYYAGTVEDPLLSGLVLIAPHFFTEPEGLAAIAAARDAYQHGQLRERLKRHHRSVDNAFRGWNDAWLHPDFEQWNIEHCLDSISVPVMTVQGRQDQYGSLKQLEVVRARCPVPVQQVVLENCAHSPHREQSEALICELNAFVNSVK